jgi:N-acetylmuramoyl-L-alanine amidase
MKILFAVEGKMSVFGGPKDKGMKPNEGLSLFASEQDMINHGLGEFLLTRKEAHASGLGRRLNPDMPYLACRWWETGLSREFLKNTWAYVENAKTGVGARARPVDSGPAEWTNRVADMSPGLAKHLKLKTDDVCRVTIAEEATEFAADFAPLSAARSTSIAGPRIYSTEDWGARPARVTYLPKKAAEGIVIHHTEYPNRAPFDDPLREREAAFDNAREIQRSHMDERGWWDTGQHFTVSQGGVITEGRHGTVAAARSGLVVRGAHAPGANDEWWGIEIAGDNRQDYTVTPQQWEALVALCTWLTRLAGKKLKLEPHKHFRSTTCPGLLVDHLKELKTAIKERAA